MCTIATLFWFGNCYNVVGDFRFASKKLLLVTHVRMFVVLWLVCEIVRVCFKGYWVELKMVGDNEKHLMDSEQHLPLIVNYHKIELCLLMETLPMIPEEDRLKILYNYNSLNLCMGF